MRAFIKRWDWKEIAKTIVMLIIAGIFVQIILESIIIINRRWAAWDRNKPAEELWVRVPTPPEYQGVCYYYTRNPYVELLCIPDEDR